jgi:hypothetical protein
MMPFLGPEGLVTDGVARWRSQLPAEGHPFRFSEGVIS